MTKNQQVIGAQNDPFGPGSNSQANDQAAVQIGGFARVSHRSFQRM